MTNYRQIDVLSDWKWAKFFLKYTGLTSSNQLCRRCISSHLKCILNDAQAKKLILILYSKMSHFRFQTTTHNSTDSTYTLECIINIGFSNKVKKNLSKCVYHEFSPSSSSGICSKSNSCLTSRILFRAFGNWSLKLKVDMQIWMANALLKVM